MVCSRYVKMDTLAPFLNISKVETDLSLDMKKLSSLKQIRELVAAALNSSFTDMNPFEPKMEKIEAQFGPIESNLYYVGRINSLLIFSLPNGIVTIGGQHVCTVGKYIC